MKPMWKAYRLEEKNYQDSEAGALRRRFVGVARIIVAAGPTALLFAAIPAGNCSPLSQSFWQSAVRSSKARPGGV